METHFVSLLAAGTFVGLLLATGQRHPRRLLGILPWALTFAALLLLLAPGAHPWWFCILGGLVSGLVAPPLTALAVGGPEKGNKRMRRTDAAVALSIVVAALLALAFALAAGGHVGHAASQPLFVAGETPIPLGLWAKHTLLAVSIIGGVASWCFLLGNGLELLLELMIWPIYRIGGCGPGLEAIPRRGPLIIIANHAAWMDPIWLGKVIPRRLFPLMGSRFFDRPILNFLMKHVVRAIRVEASQFRRQLPEVQEAVTMLARGRCLVIFPEGHMRRHKETALSRFGQGIWRILNQCPETPVVACWIEGGWGSFFSYYNGRPTKNKRLDFWRPIHIGVAAPELLPAEVLGDHRRARSYLMRRCLDARKYIGLAPLERATLTADKADAVP